MFGYVIPEKGELKVKDFEIFRAYYCGLCNQIGDISYPSKMTLTYDMTFLALLLSSLYNEKEKSGIKFCPYKMSRVAVIDNEFIKYAAELNILLSNRKLIDNYNDDKNYFSLAASKIVRLKRNFYVSSNKIEIIDKNLEAMKRLEGLKCNNIDEIGDHFAKITGEIFASSEGKENKILYTLGYNLGKWIYTLDAYDDLLEDLKRKRYNPCSLNFNYHGENPEEFKVKIRHNIEFTLIKCLDEISKAFELLDFKKNREIIENIIYLGLERKTMNILKGGCCNEKSIRSLRSKRRSITG